MPDARITVFISHVHEDETLAVHLKSLLEGIFLDADVFVSGRDLAGGQVWFEELRQKLDHATAIVALITRFSLSSKWVYFESGAGFIRQCTIPVVADGVTLDDLQPPMKLLQARRYDEEGLMALVKDIAALAHLRQPRRFPGLDEAMRGASEFLALRKTSSVPNMEAVSTSAPNPSHIIGLSLRPADSALQHKFNLLAQKAHALVSKEIERHRSAFDLPSPAEMRVMSLSDLIEVAMAVGASIPLEIRMLPLQQRLSPLRAATVWEKMNQEKTLQKAEDDIAKYERQLGSTAGG